MEELISINRRGVFSLEEARRVLPVIRKITQDLSEKVDALVSRIESASAKEKALIAALEDELNGVILLWNEKIKKLGAIPKGLWLVDFAFGRGYYCWKYPEADLHYWHTLEDGYSGRRPLEDLPFETNEQKEHTKRSNRVGPNQRPTRRF